MESRKPETAKTKHNVTCCGIMIQSKIAIALELDPSGAVEGAVNRSSCTYALLKTTCSGTALSWTQLNRCDPCNRPSIRNPMIIASHSSESHVTTMTSDDNTLNQECFGIAEQQSVQTAWSVRHCACPLITRCIAIERLRHTSLPHCHIGGLLKYRYQASDKPSTALIRRHIGDQRHC